MIRRHYLEVMLNGSLMQTHYRESGSGEPLVILHPSPMSSAFMVPVMEQIDSLARVIALDTPGYGQSDPLPEPGEGLGQYVAWLVASLDALGLESAGVYGSATGAQIAIEFAKAHPDRTRYLLLENAVHFEDAERAEIMENYFPSLEPSAAGAHLATAWRMSDALFREFPWYAYAGGDDARVVPPELVHATAMAYLVAGPDYDRAYRAAFENERAERLLEVSVETEVIRWAGGLLKDYADRFDRYDWPPHIRMRPCGPSPEERFAALRAAVAQLSAAHG